VKVINYIHNFSIFSH